jgi:hypothetical protein
MIGVLVGLPPPILQNLGEAVAGLHQQDPPLSLSLLLFSTNHAPYNVSSNSQLFMNRFGSSSSSMMDSTQHTSISMMTSTPNILQSLQLTTPSGPK